MNLCDGRNDEILTWIIHEDEMDSRLRGNDSESGDKRRVIPAQSLVLMKMGTGIHAEYQPCVARRHRAP